MGRRPFFVAFCNMMLAIAASKGLKEIQVVALALLVTELIWWLWKKRARMLQITGGVLLAAGLITGVLAVPGVAAALLLWTWALPGPSDTIGIIGGADGPTAILVTGAAVGNLFWYLIPVVLLLLGVLLLVLGCRRKR